MNSHPTKIKDEVDPALAAAAADDDDNSGSAAYIPNGGMLSSNDTENYLSCCEDGISSGVGPGLLESGGSSTSYLSSIQNGNFGDVGGRLVEKAFDMRPLLDAVLDVSNGAEDAAIPDDVLDDVDAMMLDQPSVHFTSSESEGGLEVESKGESEPVSPGKKSEPAAGCAYVLEEGFAEEVDFDCIQVNDHVPVKEVSKVLDQSSTHSSDSSRSGEHPKRTESMVRMSLLNDEILVERDYNDGRVDAHLSSDDDESGYGSAGYSSGGDGQAWTDGSWAWGAEAFQEQFGQDASPENFGWTVEVAKGASIEMGEDEGQSEIFLEGARRSNIALGPPSPLPSLPPDSSEGIRGVQDGNTTATIGNIENKVKEVSYVALETGSGRGNNEFADGKTTAMSGSNDPKKKTTEKERSKVGDPEEEVSLQTQVSEPNTAHQLAYPHESTIIIQNETHTSVLVMDGSTEVAELPLTENNSVEKGEPTCGETAVELSMANLPDLFQNKKATDRRLQESDDVILEGKVLFMNDNVPVKNIPNERLIDTFSRTCESTPPVQRDNAEGNDTIFRKKKGSKHHSPTTPLQHIRPADYSSPSSNITSTSSFPPSCSPSPMANNPDMAIRCAVATATASVKFDIIHPQGSEDGTREGGGHGRKETAETNTPPLLITLPAHPHPPSSPPHSPSKKQHSVAISTVLNMSEMFCPTISHASIFVEDHKRLLQRHQAFPPHKYVVNRSMGTGAFVTHDSRGVSVWRTPVGGGESTVSSKIKDERVRTKDDDESEPLPLKVDELPSPRDSVRSLAIWINETVLPAVADTVLPEEMTAAVMLMAVPIGRTKTEMKDDAVTGNVTEEMWNLIFWFMCVNIANEDAAGGSNKFRRLNAVEVVALVKKLERKCGLVLDDHVMTMLNKVVEGTVKSTDESAKVSLTDPKNVEQYTKEDGNEISLNGTVKSTDESAKVSFTDLKNVKQRTKEDGNEISLNNKSIKESKHQAPPSFYKTFTTNPKDVVCLLRFLKECSEKTVNDPKISESNKNTIDGDLTGNRNDSIPQTKYSADVAVESRMDGGMKRIPGGSKRCAKTALPSQPASCAYSRSLLHLPRYYTPPDKSIQPSPFELVHQVGSILRNILSFMGNPVVVSRMSEVARGCRDKIEEDKHLFIKDAVRGGALSARLRPSFWLWVCLGWGGGKNAEKRHKRARPPPYETFKKLELSGREGRWASIIRRDVDRAFGNMPPHKAESRLRNDSIVRALVTWGRKKVHVRKGVDGGNGSEVLLPTNTTSTDKDGSTGEAGRNVNTEVVCLEEIRPSDTVSDWGAGVDYEMEEKLDRRTRIVSPPSGESDGIGATTDFALAGNSLTQKVKQQMQSQLSAILHALAAAHEEVGYCQGMDYIVAHILRVVQETVKKRTDKKEKDLSDFIEETVFDLMDTFFVRYNLRHMFWPELNCLKLCCRMFERLIAQKLPVLADHFDHHDLNVGLFALGWFQTLFLYIPSMPSATVCHMWDIWLVERSFKVFFRVGTAILYLSQPILLNNDLEGMMIYLNTFPDATLLNPDILIACALQIKVTNSILVDLEMECKDDFCKFNGCP